ncbi:50S ribosomal protein L29 [Gallalistipes aquisgranensis]|uniref:50S ribosomal protein L29 n=1 Tax=Gallalistipes aquisgranensis TaxID=2779358 RepID=UPI001CF8720D|nr:50S ribosomal protein L29 [Gallalistipes aquisgranensis]MBE5034363.1 50S ribosomal protein L29 [Gallalistipes aquisgranensis]
MKTAEIKELSVADLVERIETEKANLVRVKVNHAISPVENPSTIKKARRDIARMLTILRQKQTVNS